MKFRDFSNIVFKFVSIFTIIFFWLNYYLRSFLKTLILSTLITLLVIGIFNFFGNKRTKKLNITKTDTKNIENITLQLLYNSNKNTKIYIQKLMNLNKKMQLLIDNTCYIVLPFFNSPKLSEKELSRSYKTCQNLNMKNAIILCNDSPSELVYFSNNIKNINIKIMDIKSLYFNFIKPQNYFPENIITFKETKKYKIKDVVFLLFKFENSKKFLKLGILTYFLSFFTLFRLYYLIFGSILIVFSIICKFSKKNHGFTTNQIFKQ